MLKPFCSLIGSQAPDSAPEQTRARYLRSRQTTAKSLASAKGPQTNAVLSYYLWTCYMILLHQSYLANYELYFWLCPSGNKPESIAGIDYVEVFGNEYQRLGRGKIKLEKRFYQICHRPTPRNLKKILKAEQHLTYRDKNCETFLKSHKLHSNDRGVNDEILHLALCDHGHSVGDYCYSRIRPIYQSLSRDGQHLSSRASKDLLSLMLMTDTLARNYYLLAKLELDDGLKAQWLELAHKAKHCHQDIYRVINHSDLIFNKTFTVRHAKSSYLPTTLKELISDETWAKMLADASLAKNAKGLAS